MTVCPFCSKESHRAPNQNNYYGGFEKFHLEKCAQVYIT